MTAKREPTPWDLAEELEAEEALEEAANKKSFEDTAKDCQVTEALVGHLMEKFGHWENLLGGVHLMSHEEAIRCSAHYEVLKYIQLLSERG